jgi:ribosomal protein S18 acetylase RimI-like enzyme
MILGRWREHLPDCAVLALWCDPRRIPVIVTDLLGVARDEGFERLVGPLAPENEARRYLEAGLRVTERVTVMRLDRPTHAGTPRAHAGVTVRLAREDDLARLLALDAACFDRFWRYDAASLARLMASDRVAVATVDAEIVGYTLSTLRGGDGGLGRLAVAAPHRRRGIGRALALEAVAWVAGSGARSVVLSTQEVNMASRGLYRSIGFRETGDVLVVCASDLLAPAPDAG